MTAGITLEICEIEILGCKKVFTNVEGLVPAYWLNSRRCKLLFAPCFLRAISDGYSKLGLFGCTCGAAVLGL